MGFKFRKRIKVIPGVHLNISKSGVSTSIGKAGATVNIGKNGVNCTVGIPGTGISYSEKLKNNTDSKKSTITPVKGNFFFRFAKKTVIFFIVFVAISMFINDGKDTDNVLNNQIVSAKSLRVRAAPSTNSKIIKQLVLGDKVQVKKKQDNWSLIVSNETEGWVASEYISTP